MTTPAQHCAAPTARAAAVAPGAPTVGPYRLVSEVARGGSGVVYQGVAPTGQRVAIKLLSQRAASASTRRRFGREVRALLRLRHPHLLRVIDAGEVAGIPYLVLPWVEGESLAERLHREGPQAPEEAARLVIKVAAALEHCHEHEVLHRDLKPENVLVQRDGEPLLVDFGLAKELDGLDSVTREGALLGTPGYWPPEQARGDLAAVGTHSDVYGLGALLYALLTARPPSVGQTVMALFASADQTPEAPSRLQPGVPGPVDAIVMRCLARDPRERFPSASAVSEALQGWLLRPQLRSARRRRALLSGVAVGLCAGGLLVSAAKAALASAGPGVPPSGVTAALMVAPSVAEPSPAEQARSLADEALLQLARGDHERCARACEQALLLHPGCAPALVARATLRGARHQLQGAREDLDRALTLDPRHTRALGQRAALRARVGDPEGALLDCTRAIELGARDPEVFGQRGVLRLEEGETALAAEDFSHAIELAPHDPRGWRHRGDARFELGLLDQASADYSRAIELDPGTPATYMARGNVRVEMRDFAAAMADFARAIELNPKDPEGWHMRGDTRAAQGDLAGALDDLDRALALEPQDVGSRSCRAALRRRAGDLQGALDDLTQALTWDPNDPHLLALRGDCRTDQGAPGLAAADYRQALLELQDAPRDPWEDEDAPPANFWLRGEPRIERAGLQYRLAHAEALIAAQSLR